MVLATHSSNFFKLQLSLLALLQVHSLSQGRLTVCNCQRSKHCSQGVVQQLLHVVRPALPSQQLLLSLLCITQVTRDNLLRDFHAPETEAKQKCNTEYGSGYPGGLHHPKFHHVHIGVCTKLCAVLNMFRTMLQSSLAAALKDFAIACGCCVLHMSPSGQLHELHRQHKPMTV